MAQLASIRQVSGQVSRGSAAEYQADERASYLHSCSAAVLRRGLSSLTPQPRTCEAGAVVS